MFTSSTVNDLFISLCDASVVVALSTHAYPGGVVIIYCLNVWGIVGPVGCIKSYVELNDEPQSYTDYRLYLIVNLFANNESV